MNNDRITNRILASTLEIAFDGASRSFLLASIPGMNDGVADWAISALVKDGMLVELSDASGMHTAYRTTAKGIGYLERKRAEAVAQSLVMAA